MQNILTVGLGGFLGAILRYLMSGAIQGWTKSAAFPIGTLAVNITGCFIIGLLSQAVEHHAVLTSQTRLMLMVGVLGSFTTYSTFSNETINLVTDQKLLLASANVTAHVISGLCAVVAGRFVVTWLWR